MIVAIIQITLSVVAIMTISIALGVILRRWLVGGVNTLTDGDWVVARPSSGAKVFKEERDMVFFLWRNKPANTTWNVFRYRAGIFEYHGPSDDLITNKELDGTIPAPH